MHPQIQTYKHMKFSKVLLAAFLGTLIALLVNFFVKLGVVTSMISSSSKQSEETVKLKPNSVLHMTLGYEIPERTSELGFGGLDFNTMEIQDATGLNDIIRNINHAATDPNIKGIYLDLGLGAVSASPATLQEIRNKLVDFKQSGKPVISYAESYTQGAYYLASVADKIYLTPGGMLDLHGMASQVMFYKHALDKLGIEMQIVRGPNNRFKSAVEPYFLDKMSEANREQMEKLLGSIWNEMVSGMSQSRNVSVELINQIADGLETYFDADKALEYGLVDELCYKDQVVAELRQLTGSKGKVNAINNGNYLKSYTEKSSSKNKVALVYAVGQINMGKGMENTIGSETLSKALREAREDKKVKAIVLRVNSPGGSALASDIIGREMQLAMQEKPVVVSMGDYAASGGYWISAKSNHIFAEPTTITGSIGVFGVIPNMKRFMNEKIGLTLDVAKTNENADFGSLMQPLTATQYARLQENVVKTYDDFTQLVSEGRGLRQTYVDSIGQGRVWAGVDAVELGLVDQLGDIEDAVAYAAQLAELEDYKVVEYPKQKDFLSLLLESINKEDEIRAAMKRQMGTYYHYFEALQNLPDNAEVYARMPFDMVIE